MKVCGFIRRRPPSNATSASHFGSNRNETAARRASSSTTKNPTLCRVPTNCRPGLPSPTTRRKIVACSTRESRALYCFGSALASASSAFFSLIISGATASSGAATGSSATVGSETRNTVSSSSGHGGYPGWKLDVANMEGVANVQTRNVDHNNFRQILGQASNRKQTHALLQQTAKRLDADRLSLRLEDDFCIDFFVHRNRVKVYVDDLAANRMMLDLLNQGESAGSFFSIVDLQLHQNVLADGSREEVFDVPLFDFEIGGDIFAP